MILTTNQQQQQQQQQSEEEDDFSRLFTLFEDAIYEMKDAHQSPTNKKRRRTKEDSSSDLEEEERGEGQLQLARKKGFKEILSSQEQNHHHMGMGGHHLFLKSSHEEKSLFENAHNNKTRSMVEYYPSCQDIYSEVEELPIKKSGVSAVNVSAAINQTSGGGGQARRLWVKDRSKAWWDSCSHPDFPESEFRKAFRMSKATFDIICEELKAAVTKETTTLRTPIPVRQRVAVCIWRLAHGEPLREVSKKFGLGISTCHKLVLEVCLAIKTVLMPKYVQWHDEEAQDSIRKDFEKISGIPNVVGSMYTTHIPIIAPKVSVSSYYNKRHTERNQKSSYSITVQGVVNPKGVFTDVCIGWPGSMTDDQILESSALYQRAKGGAWKGVWIAGSSSYPLMDWVLVPYSRQNLSWMHHAFNEKMGKIHGVAKEAFTKLKGRWRCLQKRTEVKLQDLPVVLGACCVLHNICEMSNEIMEPHLNFELIDDEVVPEINMRSEEATQARDKIAHDLFHHGHAGTAFL